MTGFAKTIAARKQKDSSDLRVGDIVTLNEKGLDWLIEWNHVLRNSTATITRLLSEKDGDPDYFNVSVDRPFINSHLIIAEKYLRVVGHTNRLTVKDLPKVEGIQWRSWLSNELPDEVHCLEMVSGNDPSYLFIQWRGEEHETVKQALDFCNRIADGVNKSKVGESKK